ncbi:hypothetical protein [Moritella sp. Urea-trap-13]|uniref:hypothetical protein n=1 Tax=Moritella sp. Urea-trap-13 TaxID=2058327 RepID=UPI000C342122|nr:hypothetical protein [Moritella sp. Urea-trap-13]PKH07177.1 hypothetical protein CXF93_15050 [Moritella sp. Urea-trap-13]
MHKFERLIRQCWAVIDIEVGLSYFLLKKGEGVNWGQVDKLLAENKVKDKTSYETSFYLLLCKLQD